ncbi:DDE superfamily endonuclease [Archangium gephyra]|uniref:DDE superfamily endonuclease n=1 Tax=Archangium gephyra TaxID=48 RepID=A0ABX9K312_9BACT|nr:transposase [Archangium gephyra]REG32203.1 DDE superfamily endonuclease [Archangium gephyra]
MWRRRGSRLLLPTPGKNVRPGVVGALHYPDKHFFFTHQPQHVTGDMVLPLLNQLVARAKRTGKRIVLVIDNGRPFDTRLARAALEAASPWVRPFRLPRYTSETLNWIEDFWEHLKEQRGVQERPRALPGGTSWTPIHAAITAPVRTSPRVGSMHMFTRVAVLLVPDAATPPPAP